MNYAATAAKVSKQLESKGKPATIVARGDATGWTRKFNVTTGSYYWEDAEGTVVTTDPATDTETPCNVLETKVSTGLIDGSLVQAQDRMFMCDEQPEIGNLLRVGGDTLTVVRTAPLQPGDTVIYTEVQCRE